MGCSLWDVESYAWGFIYQCFYTLLDIVEFISWKVAWSVCFFSALNDLFVAEFFLDFKQMLQPQGGFYLLQIRPSILLKSQSRWNDLIQTTCGLKMKEKPSFPVKNFDVHMPYAGGVGLPSWKEDHQSWGFKTAQFVDHHDVPVAAGVKHGAPTPYQKYAIIKWKFPTVSPWGGWRGWRYVLSSALRICMCLSPPFPFLRCFLDAPHLFWLISGSRRPQRKTPPRHVANSLHLHGEDNRTSSGVQEVSSSFKNKVKFCTLQRERGFLQLIWWGQAGAGTTELGTHA